MDGPALRCNVTDRSLSLPHDGHICLATLQRGELPRGVIDQSDLVLVVLNWCCWCCSGAAGAEDLDSG